MAQINIFSLYNFLCFNSMWYVIVAVLHVVREVYKLRETLLAYNSVKSRTIIDAFGEKGQAPSNKNRSRHLSTQLPKHHFNNEMSYICFNYYEKHSNSYTSGLGRKRRKRTNFTKTQQRAKLATNRENRMLFVDLNGNLEIKTHCKDIFKNNGSVSSSSSWTSDEQQSFSFTCQFLKQYCPTSGNFFHLNKNNFNLCYYEFAMHSTLISQLLQPHNTIINADSKGGNPVLPADLSAPSLHTMHNFDNVSKKIAETMAKGRKISTTKNAYIFGIRYDHTFQNYLQNWIS